MTRPSNTDDIIDSRDVIEAIDELRGACEDAEEAIEYKALLDLQAEAEGSPDWPHGECLIRRSYFVEYAQQLAEDCGMLKDSNDWPNRCIDWDQAARELEMDYFEVEFDGVEYLIRS